MAIFKQGEHSCYFIHIPRAAGRYISSLFENTDGVECKYHQIHKERYCGIDVTHLHYPMFLDICPENIPHLVVVRNPYNKVISSLRTMKGIHGIDYDKLLQDEHDCNEFLFREINETSAHNNWFRPQHTFLSPTTSVWKYEWGFGKNFQKWVYKKTKIKLNISKVEYDRISGEDVKSIPLSKQSQKNIKKFYQRDYSRFNY